MAVYCHVCTFWILRVCWDKNMGGHCRVCPRWGLYLQVWWPQLWPSRLWCVGMLEGAQLLVQGAAWGWGCHVLCVPWDWEEMVPLDTEKPDSTLQEHWIGSVHNNTAKVPQQLEDWIKGIRLWHTTEQTVYYDQALHNACRGCSFSSLKPKSSKMAHLSFWSGIKKIVSLPPPPLSRLCTHTGKLYMVGAQTFSIYVHITSLPFLQL